MGIERVDIDVFGKVGVQNNAYEGSRLNLRQARDGSLVTNSNLSEVALAGRLFTASNQAAVATTAALATTWTGLGLCNPTGSGKIFIVHEFGAALSVAASNAGVFGLMSSTDSGLASSITPKCCYPAAAASVAIVDDGATIAAPVLERVLGTVGTGAITTLMGVAFMPIDLRGSIIVPPGRSILTYTTLATTAAFLFNFVWEERPY